jgi:hypothetical protein
LRRLNITFLAVISLPDFFRNAKHGTIFDRVSEKRHRVVGAVGVIFALGTVAADVESGSNARIDGARWVGVADGAVL